MVTPTCCFGFLKAAGAREARSRKAVAAASASPLVCSGEPITAFGLNDSMCRLAKETKSWDGRRFLFSQKLQEAPRNNGRVDAMKDLETGSFVAVKRMPNWWMGSGPEEFWRKHPEEMEQPWADLGLVQELNRRCFPYACDFFGLFNDGRTSYVVTALAEGGDLFSWVEGLPDSPLAREREVLPIAVQICDAVRMLHDLGVAHRDLSLENVLLTADTFAPGAPLRIKLIDFGMSMTGRMQGCDDCRTAVGKPSYCAPELHSPGVFDAFAADAFSVGVMLYCMMLLDYPWSSTKPGASGSFAQAKKVGMPAFLSTRCVRGTASSSIASHEFLELAAGLMELDPAQRLCLGESCMLQDGHKSALDSPWLPAVCGKPGGAGGCAPVKGLGCDMSEPLSYESDRSSPTVASTCMVGFVMEV